VPSASLALYLIINNQNNQTMGVRKIYQAVEFKSLDTYEMVNGVKTLIEFRNASQSPSAKGLYTTANPDIIAAMDKSTSNNITFKCIHSETFGDAEAEPKTAPKPLTHAPEGPGEVTGEGGDGEGAEDTAAKGEVMQVSGIATVQAAREYLVQNCGATPSKLPNGPAVKKFAAEKKINFVDLA